MVQSIIINCLCECSSSFNAHLYGVFGFCFFAFHFLCTFLATHTPRPMRPRYRHLSAREQKIEISIFDWIIRLGRLAVVVVPYFYFHLAGNHHIFDIVIVRITTSLPRMQCFNVTHSWTKQNVPNWIPATQDTDTAHIYCELAPILLIRFKIKYSLNINIRNANNH